MYAHTYLTEQQRQKATEQQRQKARQQVCNCTFLRPVKLFVGHNDGDLIIRHRAQFQAEGMTYTYTPHLLPNATGV